MILKKCDMQTFSARCSGKRLACYGIGQDFKEMIINYEGYGWIESISFLVDSDTMKHGQIRKVGKKELEIISLECFLQNDLQDVVVLVTARKFMEIYEKLNQIRELESTECYIYHFMYAIGEGKKIQIRQTLELLIPKTIHYCWFGGGELSELYKRCIDSWKHYCPDYRLQKWDETNCDINETVFTKQAYEAGKMGFVPDYFRLKIIYEHGGIYLDTDVEVLRNLDDLLYNHAFCGLQRPGEVGLGLGFGACAGNKLLYRLMRRYIRMPFIREDGKIDQTASCIYQTADLMEEGMQYGNKIQKLHEMTIYPTEVLSPMNCITEECHISDNSYMTHYYDGSWVDGKLLEKKMERLSDVRRIQSQFV